MEKEEKESNDPELLELLQFKEEIDLHLERRKKIIFLSHNPALLDSILFHEDQLNGVELSGEDRIPRLQKKRTNGPLLEIMTDEFVSVIKQTNESDFLTSISQNLGLLKTKENEGVVNLAQSCLPFLEGVLKKWLK